MLYNRDKETSSEVEDGISCIVEARSHVYQVIFKPSWHQFCSETVPESCNPFQAKGPKRKNWCLVHKASHSHGYFGVLMINSCPSPATIHSSPCHLQHSCSIGFQQHATNVWDIPSLGLHCCMVYMATFRPSVFFLFFFSSSLILRWFPKLLFSNNS